MSHAEPKLLAAIAELTAPLGVGSIALLGVAVVILISFGILIGLFFSLWAFTGSLTGYKPNKPKNSTRNNRGRKLNINQ